MRLNSLIALALLCTLQASWAGRPVSNGTAYDQCGSLSQADMRKCLEQKSTESARALAVAQDRAMDALSGWDEDAKYVAAAKLKLAASNQFFEKYRDAQCEYDTSLGGGAIGNALRIRFLSCVTELNISRARSLTVTSVQLPRK